MIKTYDKYGFLSRIQLINRMATDIITFGKVLVKEWPFITICVGKPIILRFKTFLWVTDNKECVTSSRLKINMISYQ